MLESEAGVCLSSVFSFPKWKEIKLGGMLPWNPFSRSVFQFGYLVVTCETKTETGSVCEQVLSLIKSKLFKLLKENPDQPDFEAMKLLLLEDEM